MDNKPAPGTSRKLRWSKRIIKVVFSILIVHLVLKYQVNRPRLPLVYYTSNPNDTTRHGVTYTCGCSLPATMQARLQAPQKPTTNSNVTFKSEKNSSWRNTNICQEGNTTVNVNVLMYPNIIQPGDPNFTQMGILDSLLQDAYGFDFTTKRETRSVPGFHGVKRAHDLSWHDNTFLEPLSSIYLTKDPKQKQLKVSVDYLVNNPSESEEALQYTRAPFLRTAMTGAEHIFTPEDLADKNGMERLIWNQKSMTSFSANVLHMDFSKISSESIQLNFFELEKYSAAWLAILNAFPSLDSECSKLKKVEVANGTAICNVFTNAKNKELERPCIAMKNKTECENLYIRKNDPAVNVSVGADDDTLWSDNNVTPKDWASLLCMDYENDTVPPYLVLWKTAPAMQNISLNQFLESKKWSTDWARDSGVCINSYKNVSRQNFEEGDENTTAFMETKCHEAGYCWLTGQYHRLTDIPDQDWHNMTPPLEFPEDLFVCYLFEAQNVWIWLLFICAILFGWLGTADLICEWMIFPVSRFIWDNINKLLHKSDVKSRITDSTIVQDPSVRTFRSKALPISSGTSELQFRADVQSLGVKSWDHKYNPECALVLGDLTSSLEELRFVFFHVKAMFALFGCGLQHSIVSVFLEKEVILIKEITQEQWSGFWMNSYSGALNPFLSGRTKGGMEPTTAKMELSVLSLTKEESLSKCGVSVEGSRGQRFVRLNASDSSIPRTGNWIPTWKSWIESVILHASPDDTVRLGLWDKWQSLSVPRPQASIQQVTVEEAAPSEQNQGASGEKSGEEANPRGKNKAHPRAGQENKALVVEIIFRSSLHQFHEYSADGTAGEHITDESCHPGLCSRIEPRLTLEFSFVSEEEKLVSTKLEATYCMNPKEEWFRDWFQNNLQLSFSIVDEENDSILRRGLPDVSGRTFSQIEHKSHRGTSTSRENGFNLGTGITGGVPFANASVNGELQRRATSGWDQSVESKLTASLPTLESHSFFYIAHLGHHRRMHFKARFLGESKDPSEFYYTAPEFERVAFEPVAFSSGLQSEFYVTAKAAWELYGVECHDYDMEASKTLSKSTKMEVAEKRKWTWFRHSQREGEKNVRAGGEPEGPAERLNKLKGINTQKILQIFNRRFTLNHNFTEFFETYAQSTAHRWRLDVPNSRNPVPRIMTTTATS